jgi:tripartite-type tricarboxylate transporter receptor subunit TctC
MRRLSIAAPLPALAAVLFAFSSLAVAQSWPSRPITIVVSQAVSTAPDFVARTLSVHLAENLKVPVVVDNKGGASGNIGAEYVAKAAPDGYTLFVAPSSLSTNAAVNRKLRFDAVKSFTPILPLAEGLQSLVVSTNSPVKSVKELVALVKAQPGKLFYATPATARSITSSWSSSSWKRAWIWCMFRTRGSPAG